MEFSWSFIIDIGLVSVALLVATYLRSKIGFFQKYLIPNALTAGFILIPVYNYLLPALGVTTNSLGDMVYHLLNVSFISMSLRSAPPKEKGQARGGVFGMSTGVLLGYATQALLGLLLCVIFFPGLHLAFGLHLPLGFALGPGQAYAIGKGWEAMGFVGGASVGLTFAALGYLLACFGGVVLINVGLRKHWVSEEALKMMSNKDMLRGVIAKDEDKPSAGKLTTDTEAIDSLSYHLALVLGVYLLSFLVLKGISFLLSFAGNAGNELATNLWGINFIFSSVLASTTRKVIDKLHIGHLVDDATMTRISGFSVDFMVAGALGAISLVFVGQYWLPILVLSIVGGIMITYTVPWMSSRMFNDFRFERMLMLYGVSTGTLSTGLALLRVMDPEFKSKVSSDYMLSAGLTFVIAIPFILSINLPAKAFVTGDMKYFWLMVAVCTAYLIYVIIAYCALAKKRSFAKPRQLWYED
ncbi:MAG TPA: sodium:glutamate symporter [Spirochaetales bacterium]|nr:sodium:glutamate symporter [Spirochaetales bacterium]